MQLNPSQAHHPVINSPNIILCNSVAYGANSLQLPSTQKQKQKMKNTVYSSNSMVNSNNITEKKPSNQNGYEEKIVIVNNTAFITTKGNTTYKEKDATPRKVIQLNKSRSRSHHNSRSKHKTKTDPNLPPTMLNLSQGPLYVSQLQQIKQVNHRIQTERPNPIQNLLPTQRQKNNEGMLQKLGLKLSIMQKRVSDLHNEKQMIEVRWQQRMRQKDDRIKDLQNNIGFLIQKGEIKDKQIGGLWKMIDQIRVSRQQSNQNKTDQNQQQNTTQNFINLALTQQLQTIKTQKIRLQQQLQALKNQNIKLVQQSTKYNISLTQRQSDHTASNFYCTVSASASGSGFQGICHDFGKVVESGKEEQGDILDVQSQELRVDQIINRIAEINRENQMLKMELEKVNGQNNEIEKAKTVKLQSDLDLIKSILNKFAATEDQSKDLIHQINAVLETKQ